MLDQMRGRGSADIRMWRGAWSSTILVTALLCFHTGPVLGQEAGTVSVELNRLLPLIKVVFLLLVFFMVTGRLMASDPFPIDPPESASNGAPAEGRLIAFGRDGQLALDGIIMDEEQLLSALREELADGTRPEIRVKADGGAQATELVALLSGLRGIGAERVTLMTVPEAL